MLKILTYLCYKFRDVPDHLGSTKYRVLIPLHEKHSVNSFCSLYFFMNKEKKDMVYEKNIIGLKFI